MNVVCVENFIRVGEERGASCIQVRGLVALYGTRTAPARRSSRHHARFCSCDSPT